MIIPWLRGILPWSLAPLTWVIVATNCFVFLLSIDGKKEIKFAQVQSDILFTGHLYYQYRNPGKTHLSIQKLDNEWLLYGSQALRDPQFVTDAMSFKFVGDQIEITKWKKDFSEFNFQIAQRYTSRFGLSLNQMGLLNWITYQFTHASWMHLLGNMIMLFIFGCIIELKMGAGVLLLIYFLGGIFGGLGFFALSPLSLTPMVGASGAISAIMAFYVASERRRQVPCIYFLAPIQGFTGIINLPVWMLYPLCFLPDIAGYLTSPDELGAGVAYAAHIGGILFGIITGFVWKKYLFMFEHRTDSTYIASILAAKAAAEEEAAG